MALARPALEAFCRSITHLGGPGAGQAGKAVNQLMIAGTYAALGEGLALAEAEGLPLEALVRRSVGGAAGSWILENRSGNVIADSYPLGFRIALHLKDLRIALAEGEAHRPADGGDAPRRRAGAAAGRRRLRRRGQLLARARRQGRARRMTWIEPYLQIRSPTWPATCPRASSAYRSDVTGTAQLWRVAPDGLHEQLTFGDERITAATALARATTCWWSPRDVGGDERHALVRVDGRTGAPSCRSRTTRAPSTCRARSRRTAAATRSPTPSATASTSTSPCVGLDGTGRQELAQPGGRTCSTGRDAGILVQRPARNFDHDLFLVDPDSGALRHLTPHDGEVAYDSARLLPDGSVLCA